MLLQQHEDMIRTHQTRFREWLAFGLFSLLLSCGHGVCRGGESANAAQVQPVPAFVRTVLENTRPLKHPRGARLPLYILPISNSLRGLNDSLSKQILRDLASRGIGYTVTWDPNDSHQALAEGLRIGALAREVGLPVAVDATGCMDGFFDGSPATLHIDESGQPFSDRSFDPARPMGCPFGLAGRRPVLRERLEFFLKTYSQHGMEVDFVFADWEVDGPLEWNDAWASSKRCRRCREKIPELASFPRFQLQVRSIRSELQRECLAQPAQSVFPRVLVGNYGVYPHGGYRYWYDYYERLPEGAPFQLDQKARYREWAHEFEPCGYTLAMPVVYTWDTIYGWYDLENSDYRWFYNGLLVGSNPGRHTAPTTPIVTFVHRMTTAPPPNPDPAVRPLSPSVYQELLWHLLLRGHDGFFVWCLPNELADEVRLVHEVYAQSLDYAEFLDRGQPVSFEVPRTPGPVVSGLKLDRRILIRRTDFDGSSGTVSLRLGDRTLEIAPAQHGLHVISFE